MTVDQTEPILKNKARENTLGKYPIQLSNCMLLGQATPLHWPNALVQTKQSSTTPMGTAWRPRAVIAMGGGQTIPGNLHQAFISHFSGNPKMELGVDVQTC